METNKILRIDGTLIIEGEGSVRKLAEKCAREKISLAGADLQYADLQGADLWSANLQYADLRSADL
jgi:uncharacterized protein YjbI with pentapeptide repeats